MAGGPVMPPHPGHPAAATPPRDTAERQQLTAPTARATRRDKRAARHPAQGCDRPRDVLQKFAVTARMNPACAA